MEFKRTHRVLVKQLARQLPRAMSPKGARFMSPRNSKDATDAEMEIGNHVQPPATEERTDNQVTIAERETKTRPGKQKAVKHASRVGGEKEISLQVPVLNTNPAWPYENQ
ncbi:hypothetical protein J3459_007687 [Metarhizium acridum]|nr:hypothetical protein J3459_007687 [Metarhizium acridum]